MAKEYIERKPILKFIEDGLNNPDKSKAFGHDAIEIMTEVQYAPTADVVEVVRCKECTHFKACKEVEGATWTGYCNYGEFHTDEEDFCSRGERKVGNGS